MQPEEFISVRAILHQALPPPPSPPATYDKISPPSDPAFPLHLPHSSSVITAFQPFNRLKCKVSPLLTGRYQSFHAEASRAAFLRDCGADFLANLRGSGVSHRLGFLRDIYCVAKSPAALKVAKATITCCKQNVFS